MNTIDGEEMDLISVYFALCFPLGLLRTIELKAIKKKIQQLRFYSYRSKSLMVSVGKIAV